MIPDDASKEIWVLSELSADSSPSPVVFELLGKAAELAKACGSSVACVVYGKGAAAFAKSYEGYGVSKLYMLDRPELDFFQDEALALAIAGAARRWRPETILGPATVRGRALLPRIAALLGAGLTADCTKLEIDPESGRLHQTRPAFGGNLLATIVSEVFPQMATVRPHVFHKAEAVAGAAPCRIVDLNEFWTAPVKRGVSIARMESGSLSLADAKVIVAVGLGAGGPAGVELAKKLASKMGAALAASRSVVDSGWLDYSHQVGQTGVTVHPKLYVACGISGAIQHLVGMQGSEFVVAIDRNPEAPIAQVSDVFLRGDFMEVLPKLIERL